MRLSTYFDYFPRAAAEESGACKFVIDYDTAHLDVLAVTPKLRWAFVCLLLLLQCFAKQLRFTYSLM